MRSGSDGEHLMQRHLGTTERADRFYDEQVLDQLNPRMREFIARQEMFFLASADRRGECDSTFRAGPPGFVRVLDDRTLIYPEYRGNGVMASMGNIAENPQVGILMVDFTRDRIGLHVNGRARVLLDEEVRAHHPEISPGPGPRPPRPPMGGGNGPRGLHPLRQAHPPPAEGPPTATRGPRLGHGRLPPQGRRLLRRGGTAALVRERAAGRHRPHP